MNKVNLAMLDTYLEQGFPEFFKRRSLEILKSEKRGQSKDTYLVMFLDRLLSHKKGDKNIFLYEHINAYEELFFSLSMKSHKKKYAPPLLEKYFSKFKHHPRIYRVKIKEVQTFLGSKLINLPQFSELKEFEKLNKKTIFSFLKDLFSKKK